MSTSIDNKAIVKRFLIALGTSDEPTVRHLLAENVRAICTGTSILSGTRNYNEICSAVGMLQKMTRNGIDFEIISMTAEDDRVSCEAQGNSILINDMPYNNQYHFLFQLKNGRIFLLKEYLDTNLTDAVFGPLLLATET